MQWTGLKLGVVLLNVEKIECLCLVSMAVNVHDADVSTITINYRFYMGGDTQPQGRTTVGEVWQIRVV